MVVLPDEESSVTAALDAAALVLVLVHVVLCGVAVLVALIVG